MTPELSRLWSLIKRKAAVRKPKKATVKKKTAAKPRKATAKKKPATKAPAPRSGTVARPKKPASPKPATVAA